MKQERMQELQRSIDRPLLVGKKEHLLYLTGHSFMDGYLLVFPKTSRKQSVFFGFGLEHPRGIRHVSFRELPQQTKGEPEMLIEDSLSLRELNYIKKKLRGTRFKVVPSPVQQLRLIKSAEELTALQEAYQITAAVLTIIKRKLKSDQWTEIGLARYIRIWGLELGAEDVSFEPIVAAGKNSAVPHHHPTEQVLKAGESIVLDFGFKKNGYCSDFTRTVFLKRVPARMKTIYNHAEAAYLQALQAARSGMSGEELDSVARSYLQHVKLDKYFIHSLGHGTGLEVHELPHVSEKAQNILEDGMVFSIEPGVYLPNIGGVRIEDLVYLENNTCRRFVDVSTALTDNVIK